MSAMEAAAANPRILIVEDEPHTAEMLRAYFEGQGYGVTTVGLGQEGVALAEELLPDLIVLDIRLPDIDGYEVFQRVRAHRRTQMIPVIFLTERRERESRLHGLELGAVDYLTKPFDIHELRLRVRNVLQRATARHLTHPTTGLPAQSVSDERLRGLLGSRDWALLAVGLRGLHHFAEAYGFVARDDVVRAVGLILSHIADESGDPVAFVGHLDDENLFVLLSPEGARDVQERVTARLAEARPFFYPSADWEAQRTAAGVAWPRLDIVTGLLRAPAPPFADLEALKGALADALSAATAV